MHKFKEYWVPVLIFLVLGTLYGVEQYMKYEPPAQKNFSDIEVSRLLQRALSMEGLRGQVEGDLVTEATVTATSVEIKMRFNRTCTNANGEPSLSMMNEMHRFFDLTEVEGIEFVNRQDEDKQSRIVLNWKKDVSDKISQENEIFKNERSKRGYERTPHGPEKYEVLDDSTQVALDFLEDQGIRSRLLRISCSGSRTNGLTKGSNSLFSFDPDFALVARELQARINETN